jgi:hypothetical protein
VLVSIVSKDDRGVGRILASNPRKERSNPQIYTYEQFAKMAKKTHFVDNLTRFEN